jgi:hypothetical protein
MCFACACAVLVIQGCACSEIARESSTDRSLKNVIDVVIPVHEKDRRTIDYVIDGIRTNGKDVRRVITVSDKPYTDKAEWFDEKLYPFSKKDISNIISTVVLHGKPYDEKRLGWIFQQLLKIYALKVIPGLADNVLIIDADTIFLRPVSFIDEQGNALYDVGTENHQAYFTHAAKLIPGNKHIRKVFPNYSGICHHMLFQRNVMADLFNEVEGAHGMPLWEVLLINIDPGALILSCMADYEIYFNYAFDRSYPVKIRKLQWDNGRWSSSILQAARNSGLHYISCHTYIG